MLYTLILLVATLFLPACFANREDTAESVKNLVVINILDENLYEDCHIMGSVSVPFEQLEQYVGTIDKKTEIVVYCSNYACGASAYAVKTLQKLGFEQVYAYEGGMAEWYQKGFPVEGPCTQPYLSYVMHQEEDNSQVPTISIYALAQKMGFDMQKEQLAA